MRRWSIGRELLMSDRWFFAATAGLSLISIVAMKSAAATLNPALAWRQLLWVVLGVIAGVVVSRISYTRWLDLSPLLYALTILLLGIVELAGTVKLGAARWLTIFGFSVQPSELAKLATACCLAQYLSAQPTPLPFRSIVASAAIMAVPAGLVFAQPDLGTSSVLIAIWLGMVWVAGLPRRYFQWMIGAGLLLLPIGWHFLKEYQRTRLLVFINPHADPLGAGYTIIQSQIAIGSGQIFGRGWMSGTQNQLNFLPERHADFLFSVIGEEWGFLGSIAVVGLLAIWMWRAAVIASHSVESRGRLLGVGLLSWMAYQGVINMAMVMGLVPVVGIPLPMISYGGSAMVMAWVSTGLLENVQRNS